MSRQTGWESQKGLKPNQIGSREAERLGNTRSRVLEYVSISYPWLKIIFRQGCMCEFIFVEVRNSEDKQINQIIDLTRIMYGTWHLSDLMITVKHWVYNVYYTYDYTNWCSINLNYPSCTTGSRWLIDGVYFLDGKYNSLIDRDRFSVTINQIVDLTIFLIWWLFSDGVCLLDGNY